MKNPTAPDDSDKAADELNQLARQQLGKGMVDEAEQSLLLSLSHGKTPANCRLMGNVLFLRRNPEAALPYFREAVKLDENDHAAQAMIAETLFMMGDIESIGYSMLAIQQAPEETRYKERFIHFSPHFTFRESNGFIESTIYECLRVEEIDVSPLQGLWHNMFSRSPIFARFYKTYPSNDASTRARASSLKRLLSAYTGGGTETPAAFHFFDAENFARQADLKPLLHAYFLLGLLRLTVIDTAFEDFLTALRARLLAELDAPKLPVDDYITLCTALAHYCFETGYIFDETDAEKQRLAKLRATIEVTADYNAIKASLAVYACYAPFYELANANGIERAMAEDADLDETARDQITVFKKILHKAATFTPETAIDDETSLKVQEQYSGFPSPRWTAKPSEVSHEGAGIPLLEKGKKFLVAGTGTGNDAAQISVGFTDTDILAIDLSPTSLAYGALKAEEFGLGNITFRQEDILNVSGLRQKFDGIVASGVLHHMEDPFEGLTALADVLKPYGLMRISLYSKTARQNISLAQNAVFSRGYPNTVEGMKRFRREAASVLPANVYKALLATEDYFKLPLFRDMLFPALEHQLTLPGIKDMLHRLGLTFVKMNTSIDVLLAFQKMFPDDPQGSNIDNWHAFEQKYPDTFVCMYQFWCQKPPQKK
ncbi:MAG: class I SAM-dependent methyltransferase [Micavibrio sp.]|nr:class I SAM-dependent methyltransferase [Micavibrio sp.]